jgi:hypothetical protein
MQALELRRVPISADLEKAGDFVFVPKREPIVTNRACPCVSDRSAERIVPTPLMEIGWAEVSTERKRRNSVARI